MQRSLADNTKDQKIVEGLQKFQTRVLDLTEKMVIQRATIGKDSEEDIVAIMRTATAFVKYAMKCENELKAKMNALLKEEREMQQNQ